MGMRHFDVQMIGGMAMHEGQIAEMKTGEGKTLTATLAVVLNSLAVGEPDPADPEAGPQRRGVHVVTVNDYLARRDAEWMSPIYDALGVTVGVARPAAAGEVSRGTPYEARRPTVLRRRRSPPRTDS